MALTQSVGNCDRLVFKTFFSFLLLPSLPCVHVSEKRLAPFFIINIISSYSSVSTTQALAEHSVTDFLPCLSSQKLFFLGVGTGGWIKGSFPSFPALVVFKFQSRWVCVLVKMFLVGFQKDLWGHLSWLPCSFLHLDFWFGSVSRMLACLLACFFRQILFFSFPPFLLPFLPPPSPPSPSLPPFFIFFFFCGGGGWDSTSGWP